MQFSQLRATAFVVLSLVHGVICGILVPLNTVVRLHTTPLCWSWAGTFEDTYAVLLPLEHPRRSRQLNKMSISYFIYKINLEKPVVVEAQGILGG